MRTALAWKNLSADSRRLMLGASGVGFAVVLMFMQNGFRYALLDSPVQIFDLVEADLIATSASWYSLVSEKRFSQTLLTRAASNEAVQWAEPLVTEKARTKIRVQGFRARSIRVIGIPERAGLIKDETLQEKFELINQPDSAILDSRSKRSYGFALDDEASLAKQTIELMDRRLNIIGTLEIGTDFANDGNLIVNPGTFVKFFPFRGNFAPLSVVDLGLIKLRPGADPRIVAKQLTQLAPEQWRVETRADLLEREKNFWRSQTPIGTIFTIGVLMGFAVGVIVCYQILYTNIHDAMAELATLKAMGYSNLYFLVFVVRQAIYLSVIGFLPATVLSYGLFVWVESIAGLPMLMTVWRIGLIFVLTLLMCVTSGLLAVRKLWKADPASLF
jgi:putative ABC transport system permease protein